MREILFRGKKYNGEWIEGNLINTVCKEDESFRDAVMILGLEYERVGEYSAIRKHEFVRPETVGQYTRFSDDHLKRIFEGDICRAKNMLHNGKEELFTVEWYENGFYLIDDTGTPWHLHTLEDIENIGNIHDNPELLGGDE